MTELLELSKIEIKKGNHYRLRNIELSIHSGEKIALLGKSGSGKSTLISVANGSLKPSKGIVKWQGRNLRSLSRKKKISIGTLWQDLRLIEELNVGQNINAGTLGKRNLFWALRNLLGTIESRECISCLKAAGLPKEMLTAKISQLSGGQRQRVAIARLLRQQAKLILADEPLSNLDPKLSQEIVSLLLYQKTKYSISIPKTYLISLHYPELINHFSRVIGLKNGEKVLDRSTNNLNPKDLDWLYA